MKKISSRQLLIFYFIYSFAIKFLMLPQFLATSAGRDAWIAAGMGALIELGLLYIVLWVMSADKEKDVYHTLRSPVVAKPILTVMFAFFLLQALMTLSHTNYMLTHSLYQDFSRHLFVIPMLILGIFFCYTKTRAVFRAGEIFYVLILLAIFLAVLPGLWKVEVGDTVPMLSQGFRPILTALYRAKCRIKLSGFVHNRQKTQQKTGKEVFTCGFELILGIS